MKKILSILLLISLLTIAFTACDITPSVENEESHPQNSTESSSNNSDDVNVNDNNNNTNNNSNNDNSTNNGENNTPPSTTLTEEEKYNNALSLLSKGKNQEAYELLNEIKTYAPAQEKLKNFFYAPALIKEGHMGYTSGSNLDSAMQYDDMVYSYDSKGNITSITIPEYSKTYNYTYDSKGNELQGFPIDYPNPYYARTCSYQNGKLSKISYSDSSEEYFYNSDGSINKIVYTYQSDYYETPRIYETIYSYTYYDNNTIKTMKYEDDGIYEYQYDTNGDVIKVVIYYDDECTEIGGYYSIVYGEFGVEKVEVWIPEYSQTNPVGEITYNYDTNGRLTEVMFYEVGELTKAYLFSNYILCYSENDNARDRIDIISYTSIEKIIEFIS